MRTWPRTAAVALALALTTSAGAARSHHVIALAPVELVADGFLDLGGLVADDTGHVYVADRRAGTVTRIDPDHRRTTIATGLAHPAGLALDATGRVLVAEESADRVVRVEADGRRTTLITGLKAPRWLAADGTGTVYVAARRLTRAGLREAEAVDADPEMVVAWSAARGLRVLADDFRHLEGLALGDAAIYVATRGRRPGRAADGIVYEIALRPDGTAGAVTAVGPADRFERPLGVARDAAGALYVAAHTMRGAQRDIDHVVAKIAPDGGVSLFASGLDDPRALAFDGAGNLYVADGDAGRVVRFAAPTAPALDALPEYTRQSSIAVSGGADRDARVTISTAHAGVTTLAGSTGRFTGTIALSPDATNDIEVVSTPFRGEGLSSPPATVAVTHDGVAPTLALVSPSAGAIVRGIVTVQASASDAGSGIATVTLARASDVLAATLTPAVPAPSVSASASWDTATLPDGTHTLTAVASDRAGNTASTQRLVLVDNTPPETSIVSGPSGAVAPSVDFVFTGLDNLTPTPALEFSSRLDGGAWSPFTLATGVTLAGLAQGPHRFEVRARDQAGNDDPTPAIRDFTVGGLRLTITAPASGATVGAGLVAVRGIVEGAAGEIGVVVNDVVAATGDGTFVALVPVAPGPTTLTATAEARGGGAASAAVSVVAVPTPPGGTVRASPMSGIAPLTVAFTVSGAADGARVDLDADGNGTVDLSGERVDGQTFTFTTPGIYVATAVVTDVAGVQTATQAVIQVFDRVALDAALQAKWAGMKAALRGGDIAGALDFIVERRRQDYGSAFGALAGRLGGVDAILTDITLVRTRNAAAVYEMVRVDAGVVKSFQVRFALGGDGVWRLDSF